MLTCARSGCLKAGGNKCSGCLREQYCSGDCQKIHWKSHKLQCKVLKKLSHEFQPFAEVVRIIKEIRVVECNKIKADTRVLAHLISYAEHQFGRRVTGKAYRERQNGERIDNLNADVYIMCQICLSLVNAYEIDEPRSVMVSDDMRFLYLEKMLDILKPWSCHVELSPTSGLGSLGKDQKEFVLRLLSGTERKISLIHTHRDEFRQAESHCELAVSYARVYQGISSSEEKKTNLLCSALVDYYALRMAQGNYADALIFAEEAYNCAAITYNPVHLEVQKAAGTLIACLTIVKDYEKAEIFAQMTLDSLKDPANGVDQLSEEVAVGYYNLANAINQQKGDVMKCERLGRESLRIRTLLYDDHHLYVGSSARLLASILQRQCNYGDEPKGLFLRSLAVCKKHCGPDGGDTAEANYYLGAFYLFGAKIEPNLEIQKDLLRKSLSYHKDVVRVHTKIYGPDNPKTKRGITSVTMISYMIENGMPAVPIPGLER